MKRFFAMMLAMCMMGTMAYAAEPPVKVVTAKPNQQEVTLDGHDEKMQCYNIDGYNYFRLRDVAEMVTQHIEEEYYHFNVKYDPVLKFISLVKGEDYVPAEETAVYEIGTEAKQAVLSDTSTGYYYMQGYVIDGYTFYKIRDVARALELQVDWCEEEQVIELTSLPRFYEDGTPIVYRKPILYLYPEETTDVSVNVDCDLTVTYPAYNDGWKVTAQPDGTLMNHADGKEYSYLFWEGEGYGEMDFSEGFVVKGEDTVAFLQEKLSAMGMTPREYNEFIVYWLPSMQDNAYNLISFQWENYDASAKLNITPEPDNMLRVFMAFKALEEPVDIPEQKLPTLQREGFTVVEWGGTEM
ncbi:hypothetical protein [Anaerotignum sp.]